MKKIMILIFSTTLVMTLASCGPSTAERQQSVLEQADFPSIVTKVEAKDTTNGNSPAGCFLITVKRVNGGTWDFTSNQSFDIGDTLTVVLDTSHAYERVAKMAEDAEVAFKAQNDSTKTATDSIATADTIQN